MRCAMHLILHDMPAWSSGDTFELAEKHSHAAHRPLRPIVVLDRLWKHLYVRLVQYT